MKIEFNELTINEIDSFYNSLLSIDASEGKILLDFEDVEIIDLSIYQLLISFKKYCDSKKVKLSYTNLNAPSIKESLNIYNLNELLGINDD